jgi:hypothetical protein
MAGKGGYQAPSSPASVSGPGKYSQRTDGGPEAPDLTMRQDNYGDTKALADIKGSAPMSSSSAPPPPPQGSAPQVTPFGAESENPDEPVTAGADFGAGPGSEVMGLGMSESADLQKVRKYLPLLQQYLDDDTVPDSVRALYRYVRDAV